MLRWNISVTGQSAFAQLPGVAGEDLRMAGVLSDGPTGEGVTVAGVEAGASFNFNASLAEPHVNFPQ